MKTEKEFVDLAVNGVAKIKSANKPTKFTLTYLKHNIEQLGPTLEPERLDQLIKDLTAIFNKKRKEESDKVKGKKSKQPTINAGKALDKLDKLGEIQIDDDYEEDEYYDDEDLM
jgi:thymidine phosphorylase